jgi:DNA transposition AAA+ family ATPase
MSAVPETPTKVGGLISGDVVAEAMQQLVTAGRLNAAQATAILDFATEARKRRLSMAQMAEVLEVSTTTVSRVLRGIYEGDWKGVTQRAKTAVQLWEARAPFAKPLFVETSLAAKVQAACDFALTRQVPVILTGLSQQGKTTALKRYAERSEATVRLVRVPAATSLKEFLAEMAEACAIPVTLQNEAKKRRICQVLNARTLLIIDELHELVISCTRSSALKICEVIREFYDRTGCGMVLCGTDTLRIDLLGGANAAWLDQLVQRSVQVALPRQLNARDIAAVAAAYGLMDPPNENAQSALRGMRMNILCLLLSSARDLANKHSKPLSWDLFCQTKHALLG